MGKNNIHRNTREERQVLLYELKEKSPKQFNSLVKDKDLQIKAELQILLDHGSLKKQATGYYFGEGQDEQHIGDNQAEVIKFLQKSSSSGIYIRMKAILQGLNISFISSPKQATPKEEVVEEVSNSTVSEVTEDKVETNKRGPKPKDKE